MISKQGAQKIIELVGGEGNIKTVSHCATRLRFVVSDASQVKGDDIEQVDGVIKVIQSGGQQQVVIGPDVDDAYGIINSLLSTKEVDDGTISVKEKLTFKTATNAAFDTLSGAFTPILPAMAGAGIAKALSITLIGAGVVSATSTTVTILNAMYSALFYFLPIILGFSLATKLKANPYVAAVIGAVLVEPSIIGLAGNTDVTFLGIPMLVQNYSSTVFPVLITIPLYAWLYKKLTNVIPKNFQSITIPFISIFLFVPLVLFAFGPFGMYFGSIVSTMLTSLYDTVPFLAGGILAAAWIPVVMMGLHWGIIPIAIANIATTGSDGLLAPAIAGTWAVIGVAVGLLIKSKDQSLKSLMVSGLIPLLFAGISEPVLYGAIMRYKKVFIYTLVASAIGGALTTMVGTKLTVLFFSIISLQTNINWIPGTIVGLLTACLAAGLIIGLGYEDKK